MCLDSFHKYYTSSHIQEYHWYCCNSLAANCNGYGSLHYNIWHILAWYLLPICQDNMAMRRSSMKYKNAVHSIKAHVMCLLSDILNTTHILFPNCLYDNWQHVTYLKPIYIMYTHRILIFPELWHSHIINMVVFIPSYGFQWFPAGTSQPVCESPGLSAVCRAARPLAWQAGSPLTHKTTTKTSDKFGKLAAPVCGCWDI